MKLIYTYTFYAVLFVLLQGSSACEPPPTTPAPHISNVQNAFFQTRAAQRKSSVAAKAYYYRTLASCVKGATTLNTDIFRKASQQPIRLVVLYDATAPWASVIDKDALEELGDKKLHAILDAYQLQIAQQFVIDDKNKGWVLEPRVGLEDPVEPARLLSLVDYILMVNIKEVPDADIMASHKR